MELPIKKKYFDEIKSGRKQLEFRDAHITFVCEGSGETLRKDVLHVTMMKGVKNRYPDVLEDDDTLVFVLGGN